MNLTPTSIFPIRKLGKKRWSRRSQANPSMEPIVITVQSSLRFARPTPFLHSSLHFHRACNFLRFISSNPQSLPSIRSFSHSSRLFASVHHQRPLDPTAADEEPPPDQWKVEVHSPFVPASVSPAKLSLSDQAFFLLAFLGCTVTSFPLLLGWEF